MKKPVLYISLSFIPSKSQYTFHLTLECLLFVCENKVASCLYLFTLGFFINEIFTRICVDTCFEQLKESRRNCFSLLSLAVADPGFSRGGCANSQIGIILQIFYRKLHENERIWTGGGGRPWRLLRSANESWDL